MHLTAFDKWMVLHPYEYVIHKKCFEKKNQYNEYYRIFGQHCGISGAIEKMLVDNFS